MRKQIFIIIACAVVFAVIGWSLAAKGEILTHDNGLEAALTSDTTSGLYDLRQDLRTLLTRTLEYIDPDKELQRAVSLIDGCKEDPKTVIERYIKVKQLREDIEKMLKVLE